MEIIAWNEETDTAITPERLPEHGEWCNYIDGPRERKCQYSPQPEIQATACDEREWRDSELNKTDKLMILPDFPEKSKLEAYRKNLRDYPNSRDFPNCERPSL